MSYAHQIAEQALQRALTRQTLAPQLTKEDLADHLAITDVVQPVVYAAQDKPRRRAYRPRANLKTIAFAEVLADGAAILAKKGSIQ